MTLFYKFLHCLILFSILSVHIRKLNPISGIVHLVHFHAQQVLNNQQNYDWTSFETATYKTITKQSSKAENHIITQSKFRKRKYINKERRN